MNEIDLKELAEYMADVESRKSCSEKATELFETRGKDFCVGLILHAEIMCISRQGGGRSCTYILSACREGAVRIRR